MNEERTFREHAEKVERCLTNYLLAQEDRVHAEAALKEAKSDERNAETVFINARNEMHKAFPMMLPAPEPTTWGMEPG